MFSGMRRADIITPAAAVVSSTNQALAAARDNAADFTRVAKANINAQGNVALANMRAQTDINLGKNEIDTIQEVKQIKLDGLKEVEGIMRPAKRMAGFTALVGTLGMGAVMNQQNIINKEEVASEKAQRQKEFELTKSSIESRNNALAPVIEKIQTTLTRLKDEAKGRNQPFNAPSPTSEKPNPVAGDSGNFLTTNLSGNRKIFADAIAGPESGSWGYDAFNQFGIKGGTDTLGKRGSHLEHFGTRLTDLTLAEIFDRQNTEAKGMSVQQHLDSGGLHAVGRYQFVGGTLQDEVRRMGLDPNTTKFSPEVQDQIFFSHAKRIGNISPWIGPMNKYDQAKRNYLNSLIPTL